MWREEIGKFLQTLIFVALQFSIESKLTFGNTVSPLFALETKICSIFLLKHYQSEILQQKTQF